MDIKFSYVRLSIFFAILTLVVGATSGGHRIRGSGRVAFRRHNRREVRDYLAPPSQDASYTSYGAPSLQPPPLIPYRPGRLMNPPLPPPTTEAPGYFSRLASWLNPFGGSPTPPPLPDVYIPKYSQPHGKPQAYGPPPPPPQSYGPPVPQPPPAGPHGYLPPPGKGKNCNPCNHVPWIPLPGAIQKDTYGAGATNVEILPSNNQEAKNEGDGSFASYAEEIRSPDFSYGSPPNFAPHESSLSGPLPYPHLYPGPMPPLFKAKPFNQSPESFHPTPPIQIDSGPSNHPVDPIFSQDGSVDVLPPGAEVDTSGDVGEIRDSPPPGYVDDHLPSFGNENGHHGGGYESTSLNVQQSTIIHENHLSTELTAGYNVQAPTTASVEIFKSIPGADYSGSVDHPVHYEESPLIDLSKENGNGQQGGNQGYTNGFNPPPVDSPFTYDGSRQNESPESSKESAGKVITDSYGVPLSNEQAKDSFVASTITNGSFSNPTSAFPIPDASGLPISHEVAKPTVYENYPPSTENFLISVTDPVDNPRGPSSAGAQTPNDFSQEQRGIHEEQGGDHRDHGKIVDSYQQQIREQSNGANQHNGQSGFLNIPEPLIPYRPSSLYVPYPPYSEPHTPPNSLSSSEPSGFTTEEPFLDALLKSYNNFKQEMAVKDQFIRDHGDGLRPESQNHQAPSNPSSSGGTTWVSQPQPSFSSPDQINPSVYVSGNMMPPPPPAPSADTRPSGVKRNKQVQIIIPYTSQYTPSPFQRVTDDWSGRGPLEQTQGRKVPNFEEHDQNYVGQESKNVEITRPLKPLENLLFKEVAKKPTVKQTNQKNNSIDVLRLQKNIDNWTIQEYSRGITSSTALPSSSHPYLLPSKKIPNEYLSSNNSSVSDKRIDTNRQDLPGFNYNDVEHDAAASSRIDVPHVQVLRVDGVSKNNQYEDQKSSVTTPSAEATTSSSSFTSSNSTTTTTSTPTTTTTTTEASWQELPVSISPHNNERVYVVTPQPVRSSKSWPDVTDFDKSGKFEAIERAYQVLPQAVNNLASSSVSGPEHLPLWGIMEHDQYAKLDHENSTTSAPILYSGQSKVSNASPH